MKTKPDLSRIPKALHSLEWINMEGIDPKQFKDGDQILVLRPMFANIKRPEFGWYYEVLAMEINFDDELDEFPNFINMITGSVIDDATMDDFHFYILIH